MDFYYNENSKLILVREKVLYLCKEDKGGQNPCFETIVVIVMLLLLKLFAFTVKCTVIVLAKIYSFWLFWV